MKWIIYKMCVPSYCHISLHLILIFIHLYNYYHSIDLYFPHFHLFPLLLYYSPFATSFTPSNWGSESVNPLCWGFSRPMISYLHAGNERQGATLSAPKSPVFSLSFIRFLYSTQTSFQHFFVSYFYFVEYFNWSPHYFFHFF